MPKGRSSRRQAAFIPHTLPKPISKSHTRVRTHRERQSDEQKLIEQAINHATQRLRRDSDPKKKVVDMRRVPSRIKLLKVGDNLRSGRLHSIVNTKRSLKTRRWFVVRSTHTYDRRLSPFCAYAIEDLIG